MPLTCTMGIEPTTFGKLGVMPCKHQFHHSTEHQKHIKIKAGAPEDRLLGEEEIHIFVFADCKKRLISKKINWAEHEYMNVCPSNYRSSGAPVYSIKVINSCDFVYFANVYFNIVIFGCNYYES